MGPRPRPVCPSPRATARVLRSMPEPKGTHLPGGGGRGAVPTGPAPPRACSAVVPRGLVVEAARPPQPPERGVGTAAWTHFAGSGAGASLAAQEGTRMGNPKGTPRPPSLGRREAATSPRLRPAARPEPQQPPGPRRPAAPGPRRRPPSRPAGAPSETLTRGQERRPQLRPRFPLSRARPAPRARSVRARTFHTRRDASAGAADRLRKKETSSRGRPRLRGVTDFFSGPVCAAEPAEFGCRSRRAPIRHGGRRRAARAEACVPRP